MERDSLLVVEDSEAAWEQVREAAKRLGLDSEWALNGAEALRLCRLRRFRAIVLDLYLPLLDGISFLRIRKNEKGEQGPIVVISATANEEEIARALGLGAAAFLQKPLAVEPLVALLTQLLQPREIVPPPTTSSPR